MSTYGRQGGTAGRRGRVAKDAAVAIAMLLLAGSMVMSPEVLRPAESTATGIAPGGGAEPGRIHEGPAPTAADAEVFLSLSDRPSHGELYRAGVVERAGPMRSGAVQSWVVRVTDPEGKPVRGASIEASAWMPDASEPPSVYPRSTAELGGGLYRIEGLRFPEAGWWNVPLRISSDAGIDSLAFNLVLPARP